MKWLLFITLFLGAFLYIPVEASAQKLPKIKMEECKVDGVCGMCEKRIEKAALIKGVKLAEWDKETQILKVIYSPKKVDFENILQAVADAGHDTPKLKAQEEAYAKLPDCCKYRDGVKVH